MNNFYLKFMRGLLVVTLTLSGCAMQVKTHEPSPGVITAAAGGADGYQHGADRSGFSVGAGRHRTNDHGYFKVTGTEGTIAVDETNGSAYAVPKARSDAQRRPPFGQTPAEHDRFVLDYFKKSGVPLEQIGSVSSRVLVGGPGR